MDNRKVALQKVEFSSGFLHSGTWGTSYKYCKMERDDGLVLIFAESGYAKFLGKQKVPITGEGEQEREVMLALDMNSDGMLIKEALDIGYHDSAIVKLYGDMRALARKHGIDLADGFNSCYSRANRPIKEH